MNKRFPYILLIFLVVVFGAGFFLYNKYITTKYNTTKIDTLSRADQYFKDGELEKAYMEYKKTLVEHPDNPEILASLGKVTEKMGRLFESVEYNNKLNEMRPDTIKYLDNAYVPNLLSERLDEAMGICRKILKLNPHAVLYNSLMADIYVIKALEDKNYIKKAEELIKNGDPNQAVTYYVQGKIFFLKGDRANAIKSFEKAVAFGMDPYDEVDLQILLGHLYLWNGETKKARDSFYKIIEIAEKRKNDVDYLRLLPVPETAVLLLYTYSGESVKKETIDELYSRFDALTGKGVVDTEDTREFHLTIMAAISAKQKGDFKGALKFMEKFNSHKMVEPHAPKCFVSRMLYTSLAPSLFNTFTGDLYRDMRDKIKARQFYEKALETSPLNPAIKSRLDSVK